MEFEAGTMAHGCVLVYQNHKLQTLFLWAFNGDFNTWARLIKSLAIGDRTQSPAPVPSSGVGLRVPMLQSQGWLPWQQPPFDYLGAF